MIKESLHKDDINAEEARVWEILKEVKDPEVPVLSIIDLGIVREVSVSFKEISGSTVTGIKPQVSIIITPIQAAPPWM